ncbi:M48 family metallopeptidase [Nitrosophilus labii]|uniref:M48 family metallopeptidase n=1 Tax=Nitrosophilus labii TaxID=2706014 RepID=UPI001656F238|nr:YgjP-like metallopeptidase domain-containing protein [Nitrosophilus labii]
MNIEYKLYKERRKSLKIFIKDGEVIVKAPNFLFKNEIEDFLKKHLDWIEKRLKEYKKNKKEFIEEEKFLFMGKEYPLKFLKEIETIGDKKNDNERVVFDNAFIVNEKYKYKAKEILIGFYKKEAKEYISKRVEELSKKYDLTYNLIKINSTKRRWGL